MAAVSGSAAAGHTVYARARNAGLGANCVQRAQVGSGATLRPPTRIARAGFATRFVGRLRIRAMQSRPLGEVNASDGPGKSTVPRALASVDLPVVDPPAEATQNGTFVIQENEDTATVTVHGGREWGLVIELLLSLKGCKVFTCLWFGTC